MNRSISVLLILLLCLFSCVVSFAGDEMLPDPFTASSLKLGVRLFDDKNTVSETISLSGADDDESYLFLPDDCDRTRLEPIFDHKTLLVNGHEIKSGESTDAFDSAKRLTITADGKEYKLNVVSVGKMPTVFINTEGDSLDAIHKDKDLKEGADISVVDDGKVILSSAELDYIKGRGHSSWLHSEKRSYNIKFSKKTSLLGMNEAKKWALISNNMDATLMRNAMVYTAAKFTSLPYTVDFRFVSLYIDGIYRGLYLLCEKIEVGETRIDIRDLDKVNEQANPGIKLGKTQRMTLEEDDSFLSWYDLPKQPEDISGGYLLEYDRKNSLIDSGSGFETKSGICLVMQSPEYACEAEVRYAASLYEDFENALMSETGYNEKGKYYTEYIDVDSFVDGVLLEEFFDDSDYGNSSCYIFLPENSEKFIMGPAWDFDHAASDPDSAPKSHNVTADDLRERVGSEELTFVYQLFYHKDFTDKVISRFNEMKSIFAGDVDKTVKELSERISPAAEADRIRWQYDMNDGFDRELPSYIDKRIKALSGYYEHPEEMTGEDKKSTTGADALCDPVTICILSSAAVIALICVGFFVYRKKKKHH